MSQVQPRLQGAQRAVLLFRPGLQEGSVLASDSCCASVGCREGRKTGTGTPHLGPKGSWVQRGEGSCHVSWSQAGGCHTVLLRAPSGDPVGGEEGKKAKPGWEARGSRACFCCIRGSSELSCLREASSS